MGFLRVNFIIEYFYGYRLLIFSSEKIILFDIYDRFLRSVGK